ncbi:MAG: LCP family protein [Bacillota bacterium]|nr:LCP family protein [Bacillota bacterium]
MRKIRSWPRLVAIVLAVAVAGSGIYWAAANVILPLFFPAFGVSDNAGGDEDGFPRGRMNLLVLGVDARKGETVTRSDTIMFISAEPRQHRVSILSIPRDTRVEIPGHGWDKINAATALGGAELAQKTVSGFLDVPIDYYVLTNFEGFKKLVDILGGVTLDVEQDMQHREGDGYVIDLKKGVQRLDGEKALQYVRYRGYAMGDITRAEKQQKFLKALAQELVQSRNITKLPKLVPQLRECVETNMSVREMARWAGVARKMDDVQMVASTLPGYPLSINGASYWYVDPARARQAAAQLMDGVALASAVEEPPAGADVPQPKPEPQPQQSSPPPQETLPPSQQEPAPGEPGRKPGQDGNGGQNGQDSGDVEVIITPEPPQQPPDGGGQNPPPQDQGDLITLPPL